MKVLAPRVARSARPGQFIIVRADEHGERIPLTISDFDAAEGSVTIVTQAIGASTRKICALNEGDALADFAGPLGHPSEFVKMPLDASSGKDTSCFFLPSFRGWNWPQSIPRISKFSIFYELSKIWRSTMEFNNGNERRKLNKKWERLRILQIEMKTE